MQSHPWPQPVGHQTSSLWQLETNTTYLNHGSYGACPQGVLRHQRELQALMEQQPVHFMARLLPAMQTTVRETLAAFVQCQPDDLAFVANASAGVGIVVRSLPLQVDDEILTTQHTYNACRNVLDYVALHRGARVVTVQVPFPLNDAAELPQRILKGLTPRTRLVVLDHVTSPTGLVWDIVPIVAACNERGIDTLIDGAHALGMLPLNLTELGATYYTANFHKWLCAPKAAAMLHVRQARQASLIPAVVSHGYNAPWPTSNRFRPQFDWPGTHDPTPYLCVPAALTAMEASMPGGWPAVYAHNRAMALAARQLLCTALDMEPPSPAAMVGSLAAIPLPPGPGSATSLYDALLERGFEVPVYPWFGQRVLRISAQLYNVSAHYTALRDALMGCLAREATCSGTPMAARRA